MPLKQKLTASEYTALGSDAERANYKLAGADYVLDVEGIENITSVVSTMQSERQRANTLDGQLKEYTGAGVDLAKWKQYQAAEQQAGIGKLTDKGQYDQALATVNQQHEQEKSELQKKLDAQALDFALTTALTTAGVIPARLQDAMQIARPLVGMIEGKPGVLGADGKVDLTKDFNKWVIDDFKKDRAYLYQPNGNGGSGAHNETHTGATGDKPTKTRAEASALPATEKMAFMEQVSQGKAVLTD